MLNPGIQSLPLDILNPICFMSIFVSCTNFALIFLRFLKGFKKYLVQATAKLKYPFDYFNKTLLNLINIKRFQSIFYKNWEFSKIKINCKIFSNFTVKICKNHLISKVFKNYSLCYIFNNQQKKDGNNY